MGDRSCTSRSSIVRGRVAEESRFPHPTGPYFELSPGAAASVRVLLGLQLATGLATRAHRLAPASRRLRPIAVRAASSLAIVGAASSYMRANRRGSLQLT